MGQCVGRPDAFKKKPPDPFSMIDAQIEEKKKKMETLDQNLKKFNEKAEKRTDRKSREFFMRRASMTLTQKNTCQLQLNDLRRRSLNLKKKLKKDVQNALETSENITEVMGSLSKRQENNECEAELARIVDSNDPLQGTSRRFN